MIKKHFPILLLILAFVILLGGLGVTAYRLERKQSGEWLQSAIAHLPTGVPATQANRILGPPDRVQQTSGVLVRGVIFLAATNPQAAQHGKPQTYEQRLWKRGNVTASVLVDETGQIAGRFAWR